MTFLRRASTASPQALDVRDWVTPEDLNVHPDLLGQALAPPRRRAGAMGVDLLLIAAVASLANGWLLCGLALAALVHQRHLRTQQPVRWPVWLAVGALVVLGLVTSWRAANLSVERKASVAAEDDTPAEVKATVEAAKSLAQAGSRAELAERAASGALAITAARLAELEAERAKATRTEAQKWRDQIDGWLDEAGLSYGWGLLYFSFLPTLWAGQTPGKRLFRLRVMELTGKPMTVMQNLKRYGGYAAGMATGGLGFAQVWWDPNRQALHDKAAHTVVVDLRRTQRLDAQALQHLAAPAAPSPPTTPPPSSP